MRRSLFACVLYPAAIFILLDFLLAIYIFLRISYILSRRELFIARFPFTYNIFNTRTLRARVECTSSWHVALKRSLAC